MMFNLAAELRRVLFHIDPRGMWRLKTAKHRLRRRPRINRLRKRRSVFPSWERSLSSQAVPNPQRALK
jgi:hypothetical protein